MVDKIDLSANSLTNVLEMANTVNQVIDTIQAANGLVYISDAEFWNVDIDGSSLTNMIMTDSTGSNLTISQSSIVNSTLSTVTISDSTASNLAVSDSTLSNVHVIANTFTLVGDLVQISEGGTGANTASGARVNLEVDTIRDDIGTASVIVANTLTDLSSVDTVRINITGTANISDFGNGAPDTIKILSFASNLAIIHSSTLKLPEDSTLFVKDDDKLIMISDGSGNWDTYSYQPKGGFASAIASASLSVDTFTGDGSTNTFSLSSSPSSKNQCWVTFSGINQAKGNFTVSNTNITFTSAPANNIPVEVVTISTLPIAQILSTASRSKYTYTFTANTSNVTGADDFARTLYYEPGFVDVYLNGVMLNETNDYIANNNAYITLTSNAYANQVMEVVSWAPLNVVANNVSPAISSQDQAIPRFRGSTGAALNSSNVFISNTDVIRNVAAINDGPLGGFRNKIINGDFDFWQRATSQTSSGYGSADRWLCAHTTSTKTASRQAFTVGQTDVPGNPKYFMRHVVTTGGGAGDRVYAFQRIEGVHTLSGKVATLTFYAKADSAKDISIEFLQSFGSGGSPSSVVTPDVRSVTLSTSWQKFSYTVDIDSISGKTLGTNDDDRLEVNFWFDAGSDWNARSNSLGNQSGTFDIAHISLVEGDVTNENDPFSARHFVQEKQLCQRYYWRHTADGDNEPIAPGVVFSSTSVTCLLPYPVEMRVSPTGESGGSIEVVVGGTVLSVSAVNFISQQTWAGYVQATISGGTAGHGALLRIDSSAYLACDAEL